MMPSNSPPSATRPAPQKAPQKASRKAPTEKPASKPKRVSLVAALRHAYDEIQNCEYNLSARSKLIFNLVVRHCNPLIAVFMADIDGRPATLMHHAEAITEVEAIELRQDLFDQIITQVRQESTSKAFIKRHDGKQFAIVAIPCLQGNDDMPFAGLALAIPETRNDIIRETLDFVELLCRHALQPTAQVSTALAKNPNELDFQRISKAIGYGNEIALAFQLANSISAKFSCEQVSIGVVKDRGVRLIAISGAATIKRNSPGAIALEQAMEECCDRRG